MPPPSPQPRRRRRLFLSILAVALVAALGWGAVRYLGLWPVAAANMQAAAVLAFAPGANGLTCLADAAWSPQGDAVAVVGEASGCPTTTATEPVTLLIYDSHSGALRQHADVTAAIHAGLPADQQAAPMLAQQVQWRPDAQELAVLFTTLATSSGAGQGPYAGWGLLVVDATLTNPHVIYQPLPAVSTGFDTSFTFDLATSTVTTTANDSAGLSLAPALSYRWQAAALQPDQPLDTGSATATAPGSSAAVSIWQPGTINRYAQSKPGATFAAPVTTWQTRILAWSPDGNTVLAPLQLALRVQLAGQPTPSADALAWLGPIPAGPIRDGALQQVISHTAQGTDAANVRIPVAWSADGSLLAAYGEGFGTTLSVYATGTGSRAITYTPPTGSTPLLGGAPLLRWSPIGTRLLAATPDAGTIAIWDVAAA